MDTDNLSPRQQDVLSYLQWHLKEKNYSPTMKDISDHFDWTSPNAAHIHIKALASKGFVLKTPRGYVPV